jgi:hypothetical protein
MKLTKLATIVALSSALTIVIVGAVSAAPADSKQATAANTSARYAISATADLADTGDLSGTHSMTNPVALNISIFFSGTYGDVIGLHTEGFGFGEIARAYFIAKLSNGSITPQQVLDLKAGGLGWGEIMKQYGFKPGKGNNLGAIMSSVSHSSNQHSGQSNSSIRPAGSSNGQAGNSNGHGNSSSAPGQNKSKGKH